MKRNKLKENCLALEKRLLSYFKPKDKWDFKDYPVNTWRNPNARQPDIVFGAGIINWSLLVGHGETKEKAVEELKLTFDKRRQHYTVLPRPGTFVPIRYAATTEISKYEDIATDFFKRVLNMDYSKGFYSDGSSLSNFGGTEEEAKKQKEEIIRRAVEIYGVDISSEYDGPLYKVFELLKGKFVSGTQ